MSDGVNSPTWESDCGTVKLWLGDCLDVMKTWPDGAVDAVVTDPPYGINTKSDGTKKINPWADLCNAAFWYREWFSVCRNALSDTMNAGGSLWSFLNWRSLVTYQKASCDLNWPIESLLVWDKEWIGPGGTRGLRPSYELIALFCTGEFSIVNRGLYDIQRWKWSGQKPNGHPAEKPVEACEWIARHATNHSQIIADPFMGSGTTGVAAVRLGRQFWGVEIDPDYFKTAKGRIKDELRKVEFLEPQRVKDRQAALFSDED